MKKLYILLFTCLLLLAGCSNNIQAMLDDYNGIFTPTYKFTAPCPGEEGFEASEMLMKEYYVSSDDTLNLFGPYNANSYEWKLTDPSILIGKDTEYEVSVVLFSDHTLYQREFVLYVPESKLEIGKTYRLTLTVTDKKGNKYTDSCGIIVYQHYDFE